MRAREFARWVAVAMLVLTGPGWPAGAADGELDPTFWGDGIRDVNNSGHVVRDVEIAPDERIVVAGDRVDGDGSSIFWRAFGDFALGTLCEADLPPGGSEGILGGAAFDSQGRLVVGGRAGTDNGPVAYAMRFLYPACTLDTTFSTDGVWSSPPILSLTLSDVEIGPGDEVFLAGHSDWGAQPGIVIRLLANGVPANAFGQDGSADGMLEITTPYVKAYALELDPDGSIWLAGRGGVGTGDMLVVRLEPDGDPDAGFGGGDGWVQVAFDLGDGNFDQAEDLAIDRRNGDVVIAGRAAGGSAWGFWALARLTAAGSLDDAFSTDGMQVLMGASGSDIPWARRVEILDDGRILVAGVATLGSTGQDFVAARLFENGTLDASFGIGGVRVVTIDSTASEYDDLFGLAVQGGRPVLAGSSGTTFTTTPDAWMTVVRLTEDAIFADGFATGDTCRWATFCVGE